MKSLQKQSGYYRQMYDKVTMGMDLSIAGCCLSSVEFNPNLIQIAVVL